MRTTPDSLAAVLAKGALPRACLVTGVEQLLIDEACTLLRAKAREAGYGEREVHFVERGFDWDALMMDAASMSLFANLRLIELKFRSAPDAAAGKHLAKLAAEPPQDTLLLVTGELEPKSWKSAWVNEFERHGLVVVAVELTREQLPEWIARRLKRHDVSIAREAAELLADRVEGNLLAAQQEIERIALLRPGATLDPDAVAELVADNARYDVFELAGAAFLGNAPRALRILDGLRGEGREPPLILWALLNDLRALSRVLQHGPDGRNLDGIFRAEQVWGTRQGPLRTAVQRLTRADIDSLIAAAARADRVAKGSLRGDAWVEITGLVARIAGVPLAAA
ncbi:MAG: polymerase subunit delta [Steroidobacteraceae bacterium]|nr:polymerase subunit delta [Steroidobacteraceae bacterium]